MLCIAVSLRPFCLSGVAARRRHSRARDRSAGRCSPCPRCSFQHARPPGWFPARPARSLRRSAIGVISRTGDNNTSQPRLLTASLCTLVTAVRLWPEDDSPILTSFKALHFYGARFFSETKKKNNKSYKIKHKIEFFNLVSKPI